MERCLRSVRLEFSYDGGGLAKGGNVSLFVDGNKVGEGRVPVTVPLIFSADETTDVGYESASPVAEDYTMHTSAFNGRINWVQPTEKIYNLIRGLSPFPGAFTEMDGKTLKIYKSEKLAEQPDVPPGTRQTDGKSFLRFAASDGYILVKSLQLEGKKRMEVEDFLRGYRVA